MDRMDQRIENTNLPSVLHPSQITRKMSKIIVNLPTSPETCDQKNGASNKKGFKVEMEELQNFKNKEIASSKDNDAQPVKFKILRKLPCGKYFGLIFALMASITLSFGALIVKSMPQYHAFCWIMWRIQGILIPSFCMISYLRLGKKQKIFDTILPITAPGKWATALLLVVRGVFGCLADVFQYCSLKYLTLADSTVIALSSPIFVTFLAFFVLKERLGVVPILTGVVSLVGVAIIARPPILTGAQSFDDNLLLGNVLALSSMVMTTFLFVIMRKLQNVHFTLSTFSFGFFGSIETAMLCWVTSTFTLPQGTHDWIYAGVAVLISFFGQLFLTLALQLEDAGPVSLIRSGDAVFAYIWQFIFLSVIPDEYSIIGGILVISGIMITAVRKWLLDLPEDDSRRRKLWILLK